MHAKCILTILELNWYQQFGDNKKILQKFVIIWSRPHNCKMGHFIL